MDAPAIGLLILGIIVFSVGMRATQQRRGERRIVGQRDESNRNEAQNTSDNPIETAATGAGQKNVSEERKRDLLAPAGR